ncbi:MAG: hypothetical protein EOO67_00380 [Microbacterium sp.]|nr:MAG: hypothetical protein EOO67_00380 [Microbacterium sp.]
MTSRRTDAAASPRSDAEPFAFTRDEFLRGAYAAWWLTVGVIGLLLLGTFGTATFGAGTWFAILIVGMVTLAVVAPIVFCALLLFAPAVYVLAKAMRRVPWPVVHLAAMTVAGFLLGALTTAIVMHIVGPAVFVPGAGLVYASGPAVSLPLAWLTTSRRARLADTGLLPLPKPDPDANAEDGLADRLRSQTHGSSGR